MFEFIKSYLPQIIGTLVTLVIFYTIKYLTKKVISRYKHIRPRLEVRYKQVIKTFNIIYFIAGLFILIAIWGVDTKNLFIALSSVFAVIGVALFAQWSLLSNITAGILIYFSAPYKVGDKIQVLDKDMPIEARIESINTFYTHLCSDEGKIHILPNSLFLQKAVVIIETI